MCRRRRMAYAAAATSPISRESILRAKVLFADAILYRAGPKLGKLQSRAGERDAMRKRKYR